MDSEGTQEGSPVDTGGNAAPAPATDASAAADSTPAASQTATGGRTGSWNPLFVVGALLVLIVASLILINHFQAKKSTALPTSAPAATQPPPATPVIKGGAVAAVVNGHSISTSKFRVLLNLSVRRSAGTPGTSTKTLGSQALNQIIVYEITRQYAQAHHIAVSAKDIQKETSAIEASQGGAKRFPTFLKSLGLTPAGYNYLVSSQILEQKVATKVVHGTPLQFAHVRHILIAPAPAAKGKNSEAAALAKANGVAALLRNGGSWKTLAKKNSVDTQSAVRGGDLGDVFKASTVPAFDHAIFTLPIGKITVVHSQYGYHVLEVLSRGTKVPPAASTTGRAQQTKGFAAWIKSQMKSSKIRKLVSVG